jgi:hypothetical protein
VTARFGKVAHRSVSRGQRGIEKVDATNEIAEFLTSWRARITLAQAGLPTYGKRRVPGLRRAGVASLAGVNIDYYKRLSAAIAAASGARPRAPAR